MIKLYYESITEQGMLGAFVESEQEPVGYEGFEWTGFVAKEDTEVAYDGYTYLKGKAPAKPQSLIDLEQIAEHKAYLVSTDWVVTKCAEVPEEKSKYEDVFTKRAFARAEINRLEV